MQREHGNKVLRGVALDLLGRVIKRNPVDEGRARAGWTPYLDANSKSVDVGGRSAAAVARGKTEGSYRQKFDSVESFIEIINAVPYIVPLEFGHSTQAPFGMLRLSMLELQMGKLMTRELKKEFLKAILEVNRQMGRGRRRG